MAKTQDVSLAQKIRGTGKSDILRAGLNDSILLGLNGDDQLFGGLGDDQLIGGNGRDLLNGGAGRNTLTGGNGFDTFEIDASLVGAFQTITDFEGALPGISPAAAKKRIFEDQLSIINADGKAIVFVQNGSDVDLYIDSVHVATIMGADGAADASALLGKTVVEGTPASVGVDDVPGDNVAPIVPLEIQESATEDTGIVSGNLLPYVSDPDSDTLTFSLKAGGKVAPGFTLNPDGSWDFDTDHAEYDYLTSSDTSGYGVEYSVDDGEGGVSHGVMVIYVTGADEVKNIAPIIGDPILLEADENTGIVEGSLLGFVKDPDSDTLTFSAISARAKVISPTPEGFTLNPDGSWSFDSDDPSYAYLADGATADHTVDFEVDDNEGGLSRGSLTLRVRADDNQDPITTPQSADLIEDTGTQYGDLGLGTTDPDSPSLSFGSSAMVAGFTLNPDGKWSFDTWSSAYDYLTGNDILPIEVPYYVEDGEGGYATDTLTINLEGVGVANSPPETTTAFVELTEDTGEQGGNLYANVFDIDRDGLTWSLDIGAPGFDLGSDGYWTFNTDDSFWDYISQDTIEDIYIVYSVSDGVNSVQNSLTITLTGVDIFAGELF